jgi:hypothetical protein
MARGAVLGTPFCRHIPAVVFLDPGSAGALPWFKCLRESRIEDWLFSTCSLAGVRHRSQMHAAEKINCRLGEA